MGELSNSTRMQDSRVALGIAQAQLGIAPQEPGNAVVEDNIHIKRLLEQEAQQFL
jgi:hypothetical protein